VKPQRRLPALPHPSLFPARLPSFLPVLLPLLATLAGCASSPEPHLYTLSASEVQSLAGLPSAELTLVVDPARLNDLLDRPQWVLRRSPNEVSILELQRWAAPLRREIPRVVADNLAALVPGSRVRANGWQPEDEDAYHVSLDVLTFESLPSGEIQVEIDWQVRRAAEELAAGRSRVRQSAAETSHAAAASAFSRALAVVSADIARALVERLASPPDPASRKPGS
jgi:uncharacterized protein